ncbi:TRADD-N-associated membrane domain-containing protein [Streptomyces sp. NPDC055254]
MATVTEWFLGAGAAVVVVGAPAAMELVRGSLFERRRSEERERLLAHVAEPAAQDPLPRFQDAGGIPHQRTARLGDRRDDFTPLLVEYYAYGLTQARSSFATSQLFAGAGAAILLFGVALAVWKAQSGGELYLGVVMSAVGLVTTLVGQLFHRRADIALKHMADQTASLRDDRRAAETTQQAIGLLDDVTDPVLKARLQAGLIMKLSGAELPG